MVESCFLLLLVDSTYCLRMDREQGVRVRSRNRSGSLLATGEERWAESLERSGCPRNRKLVNLQAEPNHICGGGGVDNCRRRSSRGWIVLAVLSVAVSPLSYANGKYYSDSLKT